MGGAQVERRVARISLNSNLELRYSCFVYLFVYFGFFFLWLLLEQEHISFLGCVHLPPTYRKKSWVFPRFSWWRGRRLFTFSVCFIRNIVSQFMTLPALSTL